VSAVRLRKALLTSRDGAATALWREADGVFVLGGLVEDGSQQRRAAGRRAHDAVGGRLQLFRKRSLQTSATIHRKHAHTCHVLASSQPVADLGVREGGHTGSG